MRFSNFRLAQRFAMLLVAVVAGFVIYGVVSFRTLHQLEVGGPVYERIVQGKDLVADILPPPEYIIESYLVVLQLGIAPPGERKALVGRLGELKAEYDTRHAYWDRAGLEPGIREALLVGAHAPVGKFFELALQAYAPALERGDAAVATQALQAIQKLYAEHRAGIDKTVALANKRVEADEAAAKSTISVSEAVMLSAVVVAIGIVTLLCFVIARSVTRPLKEAVAVSEAVAAGDLTRTIEVRSTDETGQLLAAMKSMQERLASVISQIREGAEEVSSAIELYLTA